MIKHVSPFSLLPSLETLTITLRNANTPEHIPSLVEAEAKAAPALYSDRELAGNCINECLHKCQRRERRRSWVQRGEGRARAELEVVMLRSGAPFFARGGTLLSHYYLSTYILSRRC